MSRSLSKSSFSKTGLISVIMESTLSEFGLKVNNKLIYERAQNSYLQSMSRIELENMASKVKFGSWGYYAKYQTMNQ